MPRHLDRVDQGALEVRLVEVDCEAQFGRPGGDLGVDIVERVVAIDRRLAQAEHIEIWAVQNVDRFRHEGAVAGLR